MVSRLAMLSGDLEGSDEELNTPLDFQTLAAEQEVLQAPIQLFEDADIERLDQLDTECLQARTEKDSDLTVAARSLEEMALFVRKQVRKGEQFSTENAVLIDLSTSLLYSKINRNPANGVFSYESDTISVAARAIEEMEETSRGIFQYLKEKLVSAAKHIAEVIGFFNRNMVRLRWRMSNTEKMVHDIQGAKPKVDFIKPESWCKYLCYSQSGFDVGLKRVITDVTNLIDDHTQMANNSVDKYMSWFKDHAESGQDESVFDSFRYNPEDFKLPQMTEFHRTVGFQATKGDNINYRSQELPAGKAFYVEASPGESDGMQALRSFQAVRFDFDEFNPSSWNMMQAKLSAIISLPVVAWLTFVHPVAGLAAAGVGAASVLASKYTEHTGGKVVIDNKLKFNVMTHDEMQNALSGVRKGMSTLERWNVMVLQKPWKNRQLDELVDRIMDDEYSTSAIRSFCNSLIGYMSNVGSFIHAYSFKVFGAVLNFIQKSCKQYGAA
jgi:hypothetical protein